MKRRALAIAILAILVLPLALAGAKPTGGGPAVEPTTVTFLTPLVVVPATVTDLDFMTVTKGKVLHGGPSVQDPLEFARGEAHSLGVHLRFEGSNLQQDLVALLAFAKSARASNAAPVMTIVWGNLGAFDVTLAPDAKWDVAVGGANSGERGAETEFVITDANPPAFPRDLTFTHPDLGVRVWVAGFHFEPTNPWERHRESEGSPPDLEFNDGQARTMTFELTFDGFEKSQEIRPAVHALADHAFDSPSKNGTAPVDITWGDGLELRGFLLNITVRTLLACENGNHCRATASAEFSGLFRIADGKQPATQSSPHRLGHLTFEEPRLAFNAMVIAFDVWRNTSDGHVAWQDHRNADSPAPEYKAPKPMNMSVELLFDMYEEREDVELAIGPLTNLAGNLTDPHRPPVVKFVWGGGLPAFEGVLESINTKYTMFLEDGTPVRATVNVQLRNASQASPSHGHGASGNGSTTDADAHGTDHHGTSTAAEGYTEHSLGKREWANITLTGPMTADRKAMLTWFQDMANGTGSALDMKIRYWLPNPASGAWECTQVTYTPYQFGPDGPEDDKITIRAEVRGLKQGEVPQFGPKPEKQVCMIDATSTTAGHRARPDEFQKATGFTVEIDGKPSGADTFGGGEITVGLRAEPNLAGHYKPGKANFGPVFLSRPLEERSDWGEWFNLSEKTPGGFRLNLTFTCTDDEGEVVDRWNFYGGWPTKWYVPDMDSDQSGMAIERINITVEKVERA